MKLNIIGKNIRESCQILAKSEELFFLTDQRLKQHIQIHTKLCIKRGFNMAVTNSRLELFFININVNVTRVNHDFHREEIHTTWESKV